MVFRELISPTTIWRRAFLSWPAVKPFVAQRVNTRSMAAVAAMRLSASAV